MQFLVLVEEHERQNDYKFHCSVRYLLTFRFVNPAIWGGPLLILPHRISAARLFSILQRKFELKLKLLEIQHVKNIRCALTDIFSRGIISFTKRIGF